MRRLSPLLLVFAACSRGAVVSSPTSVAAPAGTEPTAAELKRDLLAFSDDSMRGRETGTHDADRAAAFLATRLASLGLEAAGDSGYFQRVPMTRTRLTASRLALRASSGETPLTLERDIAVLGSLGGPGAPLPKLDADADVVFAGYGILD